MRRLAIALYILHMQAIPDKAYFRLGEAAELIRIAPETLRTWIDHGDVDAVRLPYGRQERRIPRAEVVRLARIYARNGA